MLTWIRRSVRLKLLALMLTTTLVALVVAAAALVVYDQRVYYKRWVDDLTTQADIVGRSAVPALAFDDPRAAREYLALLKTRPAIAAAAIYDDEGRLFASYGRDGAGTLSIPAVPSGESVHRDGDDIVLVHRIIENDRQQGSVYIRARYDLAERLSDYLRILGAVSVLSMLAAVLMSAWLQRAITRPITETTNVAQQVLASRDFSLRVRKTTEDEIGYLVDAFNNMLAEIGRRAEALLEADRMKDQFLATLAHELRNPLAPISNALHLLEAAGDKPEVAAQARAMMARQVRQMVRLVDDLLDVSRITTGKLVLQKSRLDLHQIVESAVEIARPVIESRQHRLTIELPPHPVRIDGDETRLAQVFSNLLNNAAKYTEVNGSIALRAEVLANVVEVSIIDNGIGIAADVLPDVFTMFTQAQTSAQYVQAGLGVGLALARHLVEMHGGTITAHSDGVGRGSRFDVRLPLADHDIPRPEPAVRPRAGDSGGHRTLVVDDNQDFATSLAMILRDLGNDVRVENDGIEGLRAAEVFQPDVAFLDIGLPGINGYELARRLREHRGFTSMVLVAVTGWGQPRDKARTTQAGFDYHVVKPVDPEELAAILRAVDSKA